MKKIKLKFLPLVAAIIGFLVAGVLQLTKATGTYAETVISSISLSSQTASVVEGDLPDFAITNGTEHTTVDTNPSNTNWHYWGSGDSSWQGFGNDTPVAVADGTTHYGLRILLETNDNDFIFTPTVSEYSITFNGESYTNVGHTQVSVNSSHSIIVFIDLGVAEASQPVVMTTIDFHVLHNGIGGTYSVSYTTEDADEQASMNTPLNSSRNFLYAAIDEPVVLTATPAVDYSFLGWYRGDANVGQGQSYITNDLMTTNTFYEFTPSGNQYFAPKFVLSSNVASITVDPNGGNELDPTVFYGEKGQGIYEVLMSSGIRPTHPTANMLLTGICRDPQCNTEVEQEDLLTEDIIVYLKWELGVPVTFTYNLNYYNNPAQDESSVTAYVGHTVDLMNPEPVDNNHVFGGWFKAPDGDERWERNMLVEGPTKVYAHWREILTSMSFTLDAPNIGDVITTSYDEFFERDMPNIAPNAVSAEEDKYQVVMPVWVQGTCKGGSNACEQLFTGTIQASTTYYAMIDIHATDGYAINNDTLDNITVNGSAPDEYFPVFGDMDTRIVVAVTTPAVQTYTLTYDTQGGDAIPADTEEAGTIIQLPTPVKGETAFDHWEERDQQGQAIASYNAEDNYEFTHNATLIAVWNEGGENPTNYNVSFESGEGTGTMSSIPKNDGDELTFPDSTFEAPSNKKFSYWKDTGSDFEWYKPGESIEIHSNRSFIAIYIDEDKIDELRATISEPTAGSAMITTINPAGEHYTVEVVKWYEGGTAEDPGTEITNMSSTYQANTTYVLRARFTPDDGYSYIAPIWLFVNDRRAVWMSSTSTTVDATIAFEVGSAPAPSTYTVSFNAGGGSGTMQSITKDPGQTLELPLCDFEPPAQNKVFDKWDVENVGFKYPNEQITVNANTTVTAVWRNWNLKYKYQAVKAETQNITVRYQTDIPALIAEKKAEFEEGMGNSTLFDTTPLFSNTEPYKYAENGYVDQGLGELICVDGNDEIIEDDKCHSHGYDQGLLQNYNYTEVNVTRSATVSVDFNSNGGSNVLSQEVTALSTATEPQNVTREGYELAGWSKDEQIINENTGEIAAGKSYFNFSTQLDSDITLVANWKKIHTVSFNDGGILRDDLKPVSQNVVAGNPIATPKDVDGFDIRDYYNDYQFEGYFLDSGFQTAYTNQPIIATTTLYMKWHDIYTDFTNITSVNLTVTTPIVGTEITMTDPNTYTTQSPQPTVTLPENVAYELNGQQYSNWYVSNDFSSGYFTGTLVKNNTYYVAVHLGAIDSSTTVFARNVAITVNGQAITAADIYNDLDNIVFFVPVQPSLVEYEILEGEGQTHDKAQNVNDGLTVRGSGELSKLESVAVDNTVISEEYYEESEGSTIVTLLPNYLNTLAVGTHTLTINWTNGSASTEFTITDPNANPVTADTITIWNTVFVISLATLAVSVVGVKKAYKK